MLPEAASNVIRKTAAVSRSAVVRSPVSAVVRSLFASDYMEGRHDLPFDTFKNIAGFLGITPERTRQVFNAIHGGHNITEEALIDWINTRNNPPYNDRDDIIDGINGLVSAPSAEDRRAEAPRAEDRRAEAPRAEDRRAEAAEAPRAVGIGFASDQRIEGTDYLWSQLINSLYIPPRALRPEERACHSHREISRMTDIATAFTIMEARCHHVRKPLPSRTYELPEDQHQVFRNLVRDFMIRTIQPEGITPADQAGLEILVTAVTDHMQLTGLESILNSPARVAYTGVYILVVLMHFISSFTENDARARALFKQYFEYVVEDSLDAHIPPKTPTNIHAILRRWVDHHATAPAPGHADLPRDTQAVAYRSCPGGITEKFVAQLGTSLLFNDSAAVPFVPVGDEATVQGVRKQILDDLMPAFRDYVEQERIARRDYNERFRAFALGRIRPGEQLRQWNTFIDIWLADPACHIQHVGGKRKSRKHINRRIYRTRHRPRGTIRR